MSKPNEITFNENTIIRIIQEPETTWLEVNGYKIKSLGDNERKYHLRELESVFDTLHTLHYEALRADFELCISARTNFTFDAHNCILVDGKVFKQCGEHFESQLFEKLIEVRKECVNQDFKDIKLISSEVLW